MTAVRPSSALKSCIFSASTNWSEDGSCDTADVMVDVKEARKLMMNAQGSFA